MPKAHTDAYISIGSNIAPKESIKQCIQLLKKEFKVIAQSPCYETRPYGYENQQNFINLAVRVKTLLNPRELLKRLQKIEKKLGRKRKVKNGPRTIDLDILLYGSKIVKEKSIQIPHKGLFERDFMLIPLLGVNPNIVDPLTKKKIKYLKKGVRYRQIIRKIRV